MTILCNIYSALLVDLLMLSYWPKEACCYVVNCLWRRPHGRSWGIEHGFQVTAIKKLGLSVLYNHQAMYSASNSVSLEVDFFPVELPDDNAIWSKDTLIVTL